MTSRDEFEYVEHVPVWVPGPLRYDKAYHTKPGFWCVHPLENGNGLCGGNVYEIADSTGNHGCIARKDRDQ